MQRQLSVDHQTFGLFVWVLVQKFSHVLLADPAFKEFKVLLGKSELVEGIPVLHPDGLLFLHRHRATISAQFVVLA